MKKHHRHGFSLLELMIVIAIMLILAVIVIGPINDQLLLARETATISNIRTIHTAQAQYYAQFKIYAATLAELGPPHSGTAGPRAANLLPRTLSQGFANGYRYVLQGSESGYTINAVPSKFGSSGRRTFFSDERAAIHENWSAEPATSDSPELK
jgi:prepilin-type N-terminal cleavage/methylation domain-containing protein